MAFDSDSGALSCSNCGRKDNIEEFPEDNIMQEFQEEETKEYHCENCGAVVMTDADTTATSCSFCEAPVVLRDRLTGKLAPKKVIPFQISKAQAQEAFVKWCRRGILTPPGFMTERKSTRLNSSHVSISYAVFCLK